MKRENSQPLIFFIFIKLSIYEFSFLVYDYKETYLVCQLNIDHKM
jgi:hypothetical protein